MVNLAKALCAPTPRDMWQECRRPTSPSVLQESIPFALLCAVIAGYQYAAVWTCGAVLQVEAWLDRGLDSPMMATT